MSEDKNILEENGGGSDKQLSKNGIQNIIRPHVPSLIAKAMEMAEKSTNENVQLGAIKLLLSKVLPDLKATELTGESGNAIRITIQDYGAPNNTSTKAEGSSKS